MTRIEELAPHEVHQRLLELEGASRAQMANGFWKTRAQAGNDDDKKKDDAKDEEKKG